MRVYRDKSDLFIEEYIGETKVTINRIRTHKNNYDVILIIESEETQGSLIYEGIDIEYWRYLKESFVKMNSKQRESELSQLAYQMHTEVYNDF
ncbi:hypothetical protein CMI42_05415 [Candidatus Pacearchaeota archaeon]|nr:hypothetical protein [Candidatus Pacearchaeota archaeon]|tara:strand:- start:484 stop:762 length:279 start_codon:yes stop_codon:yes gene_type:complete